MDQVVGVWGSTGLLLAREAGRRRRCEERMVIWLASSEIAIGSEPVV